jgi:hypothetical protein
MQSLTEQEPGRIDAVLPTFIASTHTTVAFDTIVALVSVSLVSPLTSTTAMRNEEHLCNVSVLQRVQLSNLVTLVCCIIPQT